jgi:hypothetical protein
MLGVAVGPGAAVMGQWSHGSGPSGTTGEPEVARTVALSAEEVQAMVRELRAFQPLDGPSDALVAAFTGDAASWLPDATPRPDGGWLMLVHGASWSREVHAVLGEPWTVTRSTWRSLSWEPVSVAGDAATVNRMLPQLDGELGIHVDESGRATLIVDARYLPPGGFLGAAADAVALNRLARGTAQRLLQDIGASLLRAVEATRTSERNTPEHAGTASVD